LALARSFSPYESIFNPTQAFGRVRYGQAYDIIVTNVKDGDRYMFTFIDHYKNEVVLSFQDHPFSKQPKHVWVICRYMDQWLLTSHSRRGLEFPGGKVEIGEAPAEAAIREVKEETGGRVDSLQYIGQYKVTGKEKVIIKNIYFAEIGTIEKQSTYYETNGPVLLSFLPTDLSKDVRFSFIMKDYVLLNSLDYIKKYVKSVTW
jgi:8-oxo-dGTP diphosphatase